nr:carbohydrate porin [uncultured Cohaesibacter sp.]
MNKNEDQTTNLEHMGVFGTAVRSTTIAVVSSVLLCSTSFAQSAPNSNSEDSGGFVSRLIDYINGPGVPGPLSSVGEKLHEKGIKPVLVISNNFMTNPSLGLVKGKTERVTTVSYGADLDLEKLLGFKGSSFHVMGQYNMWTHGSEAFANAVGDSIIGHAAPFAPTDERLTKLTFEQKLFDGRFDFEVGIDNASSHFGTPVCNTPFLCQNSVTQFYNGINPPPFGNYGARVAYKLTPEVTAQAGYYRTNLNFPFSHGWEGWDGKVTLPNGEEVETNYNLFLASVSYDTTLQTDLYPTHLEAMIYYNDTDFSSPKTPEVYDSMTGIYLGAKQTIWRQSDEPTATSIALYSSLFADFGEGDDVNSELDAGVIFQGLFHDRPFDSYSAKFIWNHLSDDYASYANVGSQDEFSAGVDANLVLAGNTILQPWAMYTWNTNKAMNPTSTATADDGWAVGVNAIFLLDRALGL